LLGEFTTDGFNPSGHASHRFYTFDKNDGVGEKFKKLKEAFDTGLNDYRLCDAEKKFIGTLREMVTVSENIWINQVEKKYGYLHKLGTYIDMLNNTTYKPPTYVIDVVNKIAGNKKQGGLFIEDPKNSVMWMFESLNHRYAKLCDLFVKAPANPDLDEIREKNFEGLRGGRAVHAAQGEAAKTSPYPFNAKGANTDEAQGDSIFSADPKKRIIEAAVFIILCIFVLMIIGS